MGNKQHVLPAEVFDLLPALYPRFTTLLKSCNLTAAEVFALSCVKHSGKKVDGKNALLLAELTRMLVAVVGYEKKGGGAAGVISDLAEKGFLKKQGISKHEKQEIFPDLDGNNTVVILSENALEELETFKEQFNLAVDRLIDQLVVELTSRSRVKGGPAAARLVRLILNQFKRIAPHLVKALYSPEMATGAAGTITSKQSPAAPIGPSAT